MSVGKVKQVAFHRNGISGAGFHVVLFELDDDGMGQVKRGDLMLGIVFDEPSHVAVLAVTPLLTTDGAAFGVNSWRGDRFRAGLERAIRDNPSDGSTRVGPFAIPTERIRQEKP